MSSTIIGYICISVLIALAVPLLVIACKYIREVFKEGLECKEKSPQYEVSEADLEDQEKSPQDVVSEAEKRSIELLEQAKTTIEHSTDGFVAEWRFKLQNNLDLRAAEILVNRKQAQIIGEWLVITIINKNVQLSSTEYLIEKYYNRNSAIDRKRMIGQ